MTKHLRPSKIDQPQLLPSSVQDFRSSFRDWAAEETPFPAEAVEMSLAHTIRNKVEAAYGRTGSSWQNDGRLMKARADFATTAR